MTRKPRKEDGLDLFARAMMTGDTGDAIRWQEADGQQSLVNSDTLPAKMHGDAQAVLEAAGVKFLGAVEDDPLFQYVELPEGWRKVPTSHSMWSDLVDDQGRKRAGIFYKAAFYDRHAHLTATRRFYFAIDYERCEAELEAVAKVRRSGTVVYTTSPIQHDGIYGQDGTRSQAQDLADNEAETWLNEHYPDWRNAAAYWD